MSMAVGLFGTDGLTTQQNWHNQPVEGGGGGLANKIVSELMYLVNPSGCLTVVKGNRWDRENIANGNRHERQVTKDNQPEWILIDISTDKIPNKMS